MFKILTPWASIFLVLNFAIRDPFRFTKLETMDKRYFWYHSSFFYTIQFFSARLNWLSSYIYIFFFLRDLPMIYRLCWVGSLKPLCRDFVLYFYWLARQSRFSDLNARALIQEDWFRMQELRSFPLAITADKCWTVSNLFLLIVLTRQRVAWPSVSLTVTSWIWLSSTRHSFLYRPQ